MSGLPAIAGGRPVRPEGPPEWPPADEAVRAALERAYRDGSWGKYDGGLGTRLRQRLAAWTGGLNVLTCGSGTLAVEVALRAVGVQAGDEVILAAYDYPGNFLSVHAVGALPVLVDVDAGNWNLSVEAVAAALGPQVKAVIASHLHGGLVPMARLMAVCRERNVAVIEDAAQAIGGSVEGSLTGTSGDVGVFSFGGSKLLTAGRGGALVTANPTLAQRARLLLGRGPNLVAPLSELQAAVLLPQLDALTDRHERRSQSVAWLTRALAAVPGVTPFVNAVAGSPGYYKLGLRYDEQAFGMPRMDLAIAMRAEGVAMNEGFGALHVGRSRSRWRAAASLSEAERVHRGCLVLHHPVLLGDAADLGQVVQALERLSRWAHESSRPAPRDEPP